MKLIIVRHGESEWNRLHKWNGLTDVPLSLKGIKQAKKLARRLKMQHIDVIYSSPLNRAVDTAKEIKTFHPNAKLVVDKDLIELDGGVFEGLTHKEILLKHKSKWVEREKDRYLYEGHGGECFKTAEKRANRFLKKIFLLKKDCVVVSHLGINFCLLANLMNLSIGEVSKNQFGNISTSIFNINNNSVVLEKFNYNRPLRD